MALRQATYTQTQTSVINEGLRQYMLRTYNYMALGVAFTGLITLYIATNQHLVQPILSMQWVLFIGLLGLGWMAPKIIMSRSTTAAHACFWAYAGLWGILIAPMIVAFLNLPGGEMDIARAFFITAGMFAGASLYGYTTKKDMSSMGKFFLMASIGILIALVVNMFIDSSTFSLVLSIGVVLLFAGMTAYETQVIKRMYAQAYASGDEAVTRMSIFGAFMLYGSFITMFIHILNIIGIMRGGE